MRTARWVRTLETVALRSTVNVTGLMGTLYKVVVLYLISVRHLESVWTIMDKNVMEIILTAAMK